MSEIQRFKKTSTCPKCSNYHLFRDPHAKYVRAVNLLVRTCTFCGYQWREQCADGTLPVIRKKTKKTDEVNVAGLEDAVNEMVANVKKLFGVKD